MATSLSTQESWDDIRSALRRIDEELSRTHEGSGGGQKSARGSTDSIRTRGLSAAFTS